MKLRFAAIFFVLSFAWVSFTSEVKVDVELNPAGSFEIKTSKITGSVIKKGDKYYLKNLKVPVNSMETGMDLRDKHMKEKLLMSSHPNIEVPKAMGKGGKGVAFIVVKGVKKKINFTYKDEGSQVQVNFPLSLADFGIEGIRYMGIGVADKIVVNAKLPLKAGQ